MLIIKILFATHMNRFLCKERIVESMEEPTDNEKTYRKKNFFQQPINIIKQIVRSFFSISTIYNRARKFIHITKRLTR